MTVWRKSHNEEEEGEEGDDADAHRRSSAATTCSTFTTFTTDATAAWVETGARTPYVAGENSLSGFGESGVKGNR